MPIPPSNLANRFDAVKVYFYRKAASGLIPGTWFEKNLPAADTRQRKPDNLKIELVSHCWGYAHMMCYQLSSLILHPPTKCHIKMTVYYSEEDAGTVTLLNFIQQHAVPGVDWNWQPMHKYKLFRRSIGRNHAALATAADWIWFTDCDLLFNEGCLDSLAEALSNRQDALVFPAEERTSALLDADDPLLNAKPAETELKSIDDTRFESHHRTRATGPLQITHGDVARAVGYCNAIPVFQKPAAHWCKAHEDRVFRWLLGTHGSPVSVKNVYRIRHTEKGRYRQNTIMSRLRTQIRKLQSVMRGE